MRRDTDEMKKRRGEANNTEEIGKNTVTGGTSAYKGERFRIASQRRKDCLSVTSVTVSFMLMPP
jgi:hypothetical protein